MQISAFVDGELPENEADLLLRRMGQDAELRQKVAEYLAIGRAMRGETSVPGVDRMHERVSAALDDKPFEDHGSAEPETRRQAIRPLLGIAVAASVALLAIFGLQQTTVEPGESTAAPTIADVESDAAYTVPQPVNNQLRDYYLSHGATTNENGANGMNSRLVTLRLGEEVLEGAVEDEEDVDPAAAESPETQ